MAEDKKKNPQNRQRMAQILEGLNPDLAEKLFPKEKEGMTPPLTRSSPEVLAAATAQGKKERKRKGRRSSILTSGRGVKEGLGISRPQARESVLLGG